MLNNFNYDLFSIDENIEEKMISLQNYFVLFEQAKDSNTFTELNALMNLLEASFTIFEEHLVINLFSHCENLCNHLHAKEQLARLYFLLGMTYFKQSEYKIASTHFIESAKISASSNKPFHTCIAYCYTANCYLQIANYEKALNYTKTSFWLKNKHQITDSFISNHIYYQFCIIYKTLKLPYLDYYMHFLDEFLETDGYEPSKGQTYLLKASIEADAANYDKEYEYLKYALACYLKTSNLNRQIFVLNSILNCPALTKKTSDQNNFIRQLNKISQRFKFVNNDFSLKKQLLQFDKDQTKYPLLTFDLNDLDFQKICEDTLEEHPYLLIISLKDSTNLPFTQISSKYKYIEEFIFKEIDYDAVISAFFQNQIIFLIQKWGIKNDPSFFPKLTKHLENQVGPISFGFAQADPDIHSCRKLYNHAYVNFYYNHTN